MTSLTSARELFQVAYESRYTWDCNFPGYMANVQLIQGEEVHIGRIYINRDMSVEVIGITDEQIQEGIYTQLKDIVTHRQQTSFDKSHGDHQFIFGETDNTGAMEVAVQGDTMGSNYKIRGHEICQVSRIMGRMAFVIDTHESLDTGLGLIATRYDATFRNLQNNQVTAILKFEDTYEKFDNYFLMTQQVVQEYKDGLNTTAEFHYSNIKLLEPGVKIPGFRG
jgi:Protein of unknown function (DUF3386)